MCTYLALDSSILDLIILCFGVLTFTLPLVLFSGRAGKILDAAAKVVVLLAGVINIPKILKEIKDRVKLNLKNINTNIKNEMIMTLKLKNKCFELR